MRNSLTKKQVRVAGTLQLAYRFNDLLHIAETMPAHVLTMADAREVLSIEDELHRRLVAAIGHDFYPPEGVAKPTMAKLRTGSEQMLTEMLKTIPTPKSTPQIVQSAMQDKGKFRFKVIITNSLGSTVKTLSLHVDDKGEAEAVARETIKQLGLKKATFKIG